MNNPLLPLFFLLGASVTTAFATLFQKLGEAAAIRLAQENSHLFFFSKVQKWFFGERLRESLWFNFQFAKNLLNTCFAISAFFFFITQSPFEAALSEILAKNAVTMHLSILAFAAAATIGISLFTDFFFNLIGASYPQLFFKIYAPIASFYLTLCSPLALALYKLSRLLIPRLSSEKKVSPSFKMREKILEILNESELSHYLDRNDQRLILSMASFKERIAREVMVPRIDVFCLPSETTIEEAAEHFTKEGYSRIPIYRDNVDHIIGVIINKDVLKILAHPSPQFHAKSLIEHCVKPVLYTPETKKISHLLQEFRNKQIHMAIVVDEYGGTEGIVTIEDILEELVGEISDEYDSQEELLFASLPSGGWLVDARMSIIDIEEELGVRIPQGPEYDTVGGYIFHRAGSIPTAGWRMHHDDFDLEIISSDDRSIDKVRITPRTLTTK